MKKRLVRIVPDSLFSDVHQQLEFRRYYYDLQDCFNFFHVEILAAQTGKTVLSL